MLQVSCCLLSRVEHHRSLQLKHTLVSTFVKPDFKFQQALLQNPNPNPGPQIVNQACSKSFLGAFSGNELLPGSEPSAHCYCGYQFGYFSGQLGDGAAMYLGEVSVDLNSS